MHSQKTCGELFMITLYGRTNSINKNSGQLCWDRKWEPIKDSTLSTELTVVQARYAFSLDCCTCIFTCTSGTPHYPMWHCNIIPIFSYDYYTVCRQSVRRTMRPHTFAGSINNVNERSPLMQGRGTHVHPRIYHALGIPRKS